MNPIMKEIVRLLDLASPEKQRLAWIFIKAMTKGESK
jgi:hypothetical protein